MSMPKPSVSYHLRFTRVVSLTFLPVDLMTHGKPHLDGKILIIGGGIATSQMSPRPSRELSALSPSHQPQGSHLCAPRST